MSPSRKTWLIVACFGLLCAFAVSAESEETTDDECPSPLTGVSIPLSACYIEKSGVSKLMNQMEIVIGMLNNDQDYADSKQGKLKKMPELQEYETCSDQRIQVMVDELRWVSRRLWQLSIRLEEPAEAEVQLLDKRKVDLIRHLHSK